MPKNDNDNSRLVSAIDWAKADAASLSDAPDEESPELNECQFAELKPLSSLLSDTEIARRLAVLGGTEPVLVPIS